MILPHAGHDEVLERALNEYTETVISDVMTIVERPPYQMVQGTGSDAAVSEPIDTHAEEIEDAANQHGQDDGAE